MKAKINWTNTIFLLVTPILALAGLIYLGIHHANHWQTWVMTVVLTFAGGLSITGGYHRLFSHLAYQAAWPIRLFYALFGAACFQGSILEWCTDHRNHHRYTDRDGDPYASTKGFFFAHIGWLFRLDGSKRNFSNVEDLAKDPIVFYQDKFYIPVASFMCFIMPVLIAGCWGDWVGGFILGGCLRLVFNHHVTFCINSVCHFFGKKTYSEEQSARDNWITALFTYGEGFHNFHHQFPVDYRNGIRFYDYDPTKWLINALRWCGLAYNLKKVSMERIVKYRIRNDENTLSQRLHHYSDALIEQVQQKIEPMQQRLYKMIASLEELERHYVQIKKQKMDNYRVLLKQHKSLLKAKRRELKHYFQAWQRLLASKNRVSL